MGLNGETKDAIADGMLWTFAILTVFIILWDTWMTIREEPQHTVSECIYQWSTSMPALPFVIGFLAGHLFWRR